MYQIGKRYLRKDGGESRCVAKVDANDYPYVWAYQTALGDRIYTTSFAGMVLANAEDNALNIVGTKPIAEPIKTRHHTRFMNMYGAGLVVGGDTLEAARRAAGLNCLGILDLGEEVTLLPVNP